MKTHLNIFKYLIQASNIKTQVLHNEVMKDLDSCWLDRIEELNDWLSLRLLSFYQPLGSRFRRQRSQKWVPTLCRIFLLMRLLAALEISVLSAQWKGSSYNFCAWCLYCRSCEYIWTSFSECTISVWGKLTPLPVSPSNFGSVLPSSKLSTTIPSSTKSPQSGLKQKKQQPKTNIIHSHSIWHWTAGKRMLCHLSSL